MHPESSVLSALYSLKFWHQLKPFQPFFFFSPPLPQYWFIVKLNPARFLKVSPLNIYLTANKMKETHYAFNVIRALAKEK